MEGRKINPAPLKEKTSLVLILAGAFLLQAVLQGATEGYSYDMGCFYAWAGRLASLGPGEFYSPDYFADYPPGGILALYPAGIIRNLPWPGNWCWAFCPLWQSAASLTLPGARQDG